MSERAVGTAEREALDRLHARMVAIRCEQYRLLEDVAELERLGVAVATGNRTTERLLQDSLRIDLKDARRLVGESEDLTPQLSLRGPATPRPGRWCWARSRSRWTSGAARAWSRTRCAGR